MDGMNDINNKNDDILKRETGLFLYCVVVLFLIFAVVLVNPWISWRERMSVTIEEKEKGLEELKERCEKLKLEVELLRGNANEENE